MHDRRKKKNMLKTHRSFVADITLHQKQLTNMFEEYLNTPLSNLINNLYLLKY